MLLPGVAVGVGAPVGSTRLQAGGALMPGGVPGIDGNGAPGGVGARGAAQRQYLAVGQQEVL